MRGYKMHPTKKYLYHWHARIWMNSARKPSINWFAISEEIIFVFCDNVVMQLAYAWIINVLFLVID